MKRVFLAVVAILLSQTMPASQDLTLSKSEREFLEREVDRISDEVIDLTHQNRWEEAFDLGLELYEREVDLLGERAWDVAGSHQSLADILEHLGQLEEARDHLEMVIDIAGDCPGQALVDGDGGEFSGRFRFALRRQR